MISRINRINGFGIFQDFKADKTLQNFTRFNLIYGFNGSGKTTLSRLFHAIGIKSLNSSFTSGSFDLLLSDGISLKSNKLDQNTTPLYVFNKHFIDENINWEQQGAKSILVISGENKEDRDRYFKLKETILPRANESSIRASAIFDASEKERSSFLSNQARSIKQAFEIIDTSDSRYLNYDKRKLERFISEHENETKNSDSILSEDALSQLSEKVKATHLPEVVLDSPSLELDNIIAILKTASELVSTNITNKTIERLDNNPDINSWTHNGYILHKNHNPNKCEYCGQNIPQERVKDLDQHFNETYNELMTSLSNCIEEIESVEIDFPLPEKGELFNEFRDPFSAQEKEFFEAKKEVTDYLSQLKTVLNLKKDRPFENQHIPPSDIHTSLKKLKTCAKGLSSVVENHNHQSQQFNKELAKSKAQFELHYVTQAVSEGKYYELLLRIEAEKNAVETTREHLQTLIKEFGALEAKLSNANIAAEEFNKQLSEFLGRPEIALQYDQASKGYKLVRSGTKAPAKHLSEGEKTAIAFVYFINKATENGNKIEDSIIVVDDPISSFDSNHLYNSYAYLKSHFEKAKQLFILTHNFQYFKLIRDWLIKKNDRNKDPKASVFTVEASLGTNRNSTINNAPDSLLKYNSEYHFIFSELTKFSEKDKLDPASSYQVANYSRKLLEAFFSFKHPKNRNDFNALMEAGCKKAGITDTQKERVYRFINKYSHYQVIEIEDTALDNILDEGDNIVTSVFNILELSDETHFNEMKEVCA